MRAALYARVSTPDQNLSNQLYQLREICAERGFEVVGEYTDTISGTKSRRPGLDSLLADAQRKRYQVVLVAAFDRVARSTKHFLQILDAFETLGIEFISARENIETSGPMGRLFVTLLGSISELEGSLIRERIRRGLHRRRLEGFKLGRQPVLSPVERDRLVADRRAGLSLTKTAKKYAVSRATVVRLTREAAQRENIVSMPAVLSPNEQPVEALA